MTERFMKSCTIVAVVSLAFLAGCGWGEKKEEQKSGTSAQKVLLVNVLSKEYYDDARIAGSINVPSEKLLIEAEKWDKGIPVIVYCSNFMCSASVDGARKLQKDGFKDVFAYEGGMAEWYQLSREDNSYVVEGPAKQDYLSVKVAAPSEKASDVKVITAQALRDKLRNT